MSEKTPEWIQLAADEISGDPSCCDIQSADTGRIAQVIEGHYDRAREDGFEWDPSAHPKCPECGRLLTWQELGEDDAGHFLGYWQCIKQHRDPRHCDKSK